MTDVFSQIKGRLAEEISRRGPCQFEPLNADQWIISSLLQKAIRRGETEIAKRAASSLLAERGSAIWRRFMVIAFEDVGAGCPEVVTATVAACTDAAWRKTAGGAAVVASHVAQLLADAGKDRSADYLICGAKDHPWLALARERLRAASAAERLRAVADARLSVPERSLAAWYASELEWTGKRRAGNSALDQLLQVFKNLGVPSDLVAATSVAARRTREPITLMVPLLWLAANDGQCPDCVKTTVPASLVVDGVPLYALDKHTRLGREAIWHFASRNDEVRAALDEHVPPTRRRDAAYMAAFYADAAPVANKLVWKGADELEAFGTETDLLKAGVCPEGSAPLLAAFRNNLGHLNEIRAECFVRQRSAASGLISSRPAGGLG